MTELGHDMSGNNVEVRLARLEVVVAAMEKATKLQAKEYERRLHDLNGEYKRDRERQTQFVSAEKFEDNLEAEATAREAALLRVDEKFEEYVKRYEVRQREIDQQLTLMQGASEQAERQIKEQAAKTNRNLAIVAVIVTFTIGMANYLGTL